MAFGVISGAPIIASRRANGKTQTDAFEIASQIVVESINVTNLPLRSVLERLERIANEQSSTQGVCLTLRQDHASRKELPPLTFQGGYVPLPVLLATIAEAEGLECRYGKREIVMAEKDDHSDSFRGVRQAESARQTNAILDDAAPNGLSVRQWFVIPSNRSTGKGDEQDGARWKQYFAEHGVGWPNGAKVVYFPDNGILSVCNTSDNLEAADEIIKKLAKGNQ